MILKIPTGLQTIGSVDFMFKVNMFDSVISNVVNIEKINDSDLRLLGVVFNGRVWYTARDPTRDH